MERSSMDGDELPEEVRVNEVLNAATEEGSPSHTRSSRQIFTSMGQVDADLALARALQQQEHAYLLLRMGHEGSEYDTSGSGSFNYDYAPEEEGVEEDADEQPSERRLLDLGLAFVSGRGDEDGGEEEVDGSLYENDEEFARALQVADASYMINLIGVGESDEEDEDGSYGSQDVWQDVDPDNMSYEELVALGEAVGTQSKGLKPDVIAALPLSKFVHNDDGSSTASSDDQCVICRVEYEDGDYLSTLPCKHQYHSDCIKHWLQINKACPICSADVTL